MHDKLLQAVEKMPAFPKSVQQVLVLTSRMDCTPRELVDVIKNDPVFTLKILRLVNSPFFGLAKEMTSVGQASVYLGINTLKNIALGLAAVGSLPRKNAAGLNMGAFWLHSLAVASGARLLAVLAGLTRDEAADAFAAGLLHDVGKVVFALHVPEEFKQSLKRAESGAVPLYEAEREFILFSHTAIGQLLAEKWNLPQTLTDAVALHHDPDRLADSPISCCVFAANQLAKKLDYGFAGDHVLEAFPKQLETLFQCDFDGLEEKLPELKEEVDKSRVFIQLGASAA